MSGDELATTIRAQCVKGKNGVWSALRTLYACVCLAVVVMFFVMGLLAISIPLTLDLLLFRPRKRGRLQSTQDGL